jgi:lipase
VAATSPLFVTSFNQGPEWILALHGVEAHGLRFLKLASLMPARRIVAPDLRGHGRSPGEGPWTVEQHVRDLRPLLESSQRAPALLGHSFGGLVAWELARAQPERVARLVLVDPAVGVSAEVAQEGKAAAATERSAPDVLEAVATALSDRSVQGWWAAALDVAAGMERLESGELRELARAEAIVGAWDEMRRPLSESPYRGPTVLIEAAQENGRYVSAELVKALRAQLGSNLAHVRLDAAHSLPVDAPEALASLLADGPS